jgi:mono/diheme cytochrome c family protein
MSDSPAHEHDDHGPEPTELTHPLLWTAGLVVSALGLVWLFFHCMSEGGRAARGEVPVSQLMAPSGAPEPDHLALIADRSPEVLALGRKVFTTNCASCHGMNGDLKGGTQPQARNFHTDAFKNPNHGGPFALYQVVSHGYGLMPAFMGIDPASRYAAVHYIREAFVKKYNPANYVENDPPDVLAQIPKPGVAGSAEPSLPPNERPAPPLLYPLLQAESEQGAATMASLRQWSDAMSAAATPENRQEVDRLRSLALHNGGLGVALRDAAKSGDRPRFIELLTASHVPGAAATDFALMPGDRLTMLYDVARSGAEGSH